MSRRRGSRVPSWMQVLLLSALFPNCKGKLVGPPLATGGANSTHLVGAAGDNSDRSGQFGGGTTRYGSGGTSALVDSVFGLGASYHLAGGTTGDSLWVSSTVGGHPIDRGGTTSIGMPVGGGPTPNGSSGDAGRLNNTFYPAGTGAGRGGVSSVSTLAFCGVDQSRLDNCILE